jgi:hypothetical protein
MLTFLVSLIHEFGVCEVTQIAAERVRARAVSSANATTSHGDHFDRRLLT